MLKFNRLIVWGALLTTVLAGACISVQGFASQEMKGTLEGQVLVAVSLMGAYMTLVIGIIVVAVGSYNNLLLRRAEAALDTPRNRRHYRTGMTFCALGLALIFFLPLL